MLAQTDAPQMPSRGESLERARRAGLDLHSASDLWAWSSGLNTRTQELESVDKTLPTIGPTPWDGDRHPCHYLPPGPASVTVPVSGVARLDCLISVSVKS